MPFTIQTERTPAYLRLTVAGPPSLKNYFDLIELAAKESLEHGDKRLFNDLRGVTGRLSFTDQFFIGEVVVEKLAHVERIAVLVNEDPDSYNSPKVAQRKGVDIRSFASEAAALRWLTDG